MGATVATYQAIAKQASTVYGLGLMAQGFSLLGFGIFGSGFKVYLLGLRV